MICTATLLSAGTFRTGAQAASSIDLAVDPGSTTVQPGAQFDLTVQAQAGITEVNGVELHLSFDPALLSVVSLTPAVGLPMPLAQAFDNAAGTIDASYVQLVAPFPSGTFTALTVRFQALAETPGTTVGFNLALPRQTLASANGVIDSALGTTTDGTVIIENQPPALSVGQLSVTANEGAAAANSGTVSDPEHDPVILSTSVGTAINNGDGTWSSGYTPDDGPAQSQTVTISAADGHNNPVEATFNLTVNNLPPTAAFANTSGAIRAGGTAVLTFTGAADPSAADTAAGFRYSFDCTNDGVFEATQAASATFGCVYPARGAFTARGRIEDKDGGFTDYLADVTVRPNVGLAVERLDRFTGFQDEPTFVAEGATIGDRYRIHLLTQPTADVTVLVRTADPADLTLMGPGFKPVNSMSLTFRWNDNDPNNSILGWNDWYSLSVSGVADGLAEGAEVHNIEYVLTSADPDYNGLVVPPEPVTVYDAGVVVTPLVTSVNEGASAGYYSVVLSGPPGLSLPSNTPEAVTVALSGYDSSLISGVPAALTFTRTNWNVPQVVTIQATEDSVDRGTTYTTTINHSVSSNITTLDSLYGGAGVNVTVSPMTVTIQDNDQATADVEVAARWLASPVGQGTPAILQVNVRNNGPSAVSDVQVALGTLMTGQVAFVSASGSGAYDPATDMWSIPLIPPAPGGGSTVTLELTVNTVAAGSLTVTPSLSHLNLPDTNSSNNAYSASLEVVNTLAVAPVVDLPPLIGGRQATAEPPLNLMPQPVPVFQSMDDGAPLWSSVGTWHLTPGAAYGGNGLGWETAEGDGVSALVLNVPLDLRAAQFPVLHFQSKLVGTAGIATVEASLGGALWQVVSPVATSKDWSGVDTSLMAYAGQMVQLRFVWNLPPSDTGEALADRWQVDDVSVVDAPPLFEPSVTPTSVPTDVPTPTEAVVISTETPVPAIEAPTTQPTAEPSLTPTSLPTDLPAQEQSPTELSATEST